MKADEAAIIARVLQVPVEEVIRKLDARASQEDDLRSVGEPIVQVPLISWVKAGELAELEDPYSVGGAEEWIPVSSKRETLIALRIDGTSINRVAPHGSIIIVDYNDTQLVVGKLYAIRTAEGRGSVKVYKTNPDRFEPDSTDPHDTIFPTGETRIIGRVISAVTRL